MSRSGTYYLFVSLLALFSTIFLENYASCNASLTHRREGITKSLSRQGEERLVGAVGNVLRYRKARTKERKIPTSVAERNITAMERMQTQLAIKFKKRISVKTFLHVVSSYLQMCHGTCSLAG